MLKSELGQVPWAVGESHVGEFPGWLLCRAGKEVAPRLPPAQVWASGKQVEDKVLWGGVLSVRLLFKMSKV